MATSTPKGNPVITYDFRQALKGETVNRSFHQIVENGVYSGLTLSKIDDTTVRVSTGVIFIGDSTKGVSVKSENTTTWDVTVSNAEPYIIARYNWINIEENYPDYLAVTNAGILSDDVILGRCIFDGTTLRTTFDLNRRQYSSFNTDKQKNNYFKVLAREPYSNIVDVSSGTAIIKGVYIDFPGDDITIPNTILGRIDIVCLDSTSSLQLVQGVDSASPVSPIVPFNYMPLAYIRRGASATTVNGSDIENLNNLIFKNNSFADVGSDYLLKASNLSDVANTSTALENITTDSRLSKDCLLITDEDIHTIAETNGSGWYKGSNVTNAPVTGVGIFYIFHVSGISLNIKVTAMSFTDNLIYYKSRIGGTWGSWIPVITQPDGDNRYLIKSNNLSDLASTPTALTNLGVYSKTESDDRYLNESSNLSDVANTSTALENITTDSRLGLNGQIITDEDIHTIAETNGSGWYKGSNVTNAPVTGVGIWYIFNVMCTGTNIKVLASPFTNDTLFMKKRLNGVWSGWVEIAVHDNFITYTSTGSNSVEQTGTSGNNVIFNVAGSPSLILPTGKWLIFGATTLNNINANVTRVGLSLWNVTTSSAFGGGGFDASFVDTYPFSISCSGLLTVTAATNTIRLYGVQQGTGVLTVGNTVPVPCGYLQAVRI